MSANRPGKAVDLHRVIKDRQVRSVVQTLLEDGWTFVRLSSSNHPILAYETSDGAQRRITMPLSPSDRRAMRNTLADARRISGIDHGRTGKERPGGAVRTGQSRTEIDQPRPGSESATAGSKAAGPRSSKRR